MVESRIGGSVLKAPARHAWPTVVLVVCDCGAPYIEKRELFIVGSAAAWPSGPQFSPGSLGVSQIPSNITNSVGFLGGVLTKVIPFEECRIESSTLAEEYCRLRYDTESAALSGRVTDASCFGELVVDAAVELRELDPSTPASVKVRHTLVKRSGEFRIEALEAGMRYEIKVDRETENVLHRYYPHTDTLELAPGEQARYDVELRRVFPC